MKPLLIVTCCIASAALIIGIVLVTHVMWPAPTAAVATTAPVAAAEAKPPAAVQPATQPDVVPDPPKPKNPAIMLMVETPREAHAWVNYFDGDGVQRGVHIVCPIAQTADQSERNSKILSDLLASILLPHNPLGWAKLGSDVLQPAEAPKAGACQILKRTWHYQYGGNGRLEMVEGSNNLGSVKMPN